MAKEFKSELGGGGAPQRQPGGKRRWTDHPEAGNIAGEVGRPGGDQEAQRKRRGRP